MKFPCLVKFMYVDHSRHSLVTSEEEFEEKRYDYGCWNHEVIDWERLTPAAFPGTCNDLLILMRSEPDEIK